MTNLPPELTELATQAKQLELPLLHQLIEHLQLDLTTRSNQNQLDRDLPGISTFLHKKVQEFLLKEPRYQAIHSVCHIAFHNGRLFSEPNYDSKLVAKHPGYTQLLEELKETYKLTASFEYYDNDYGTTCLHITEVQGVPIIERGY